MKIFFLVNISRREQEPEPEILENFRRILSESGHEYRIESADNPDMARSLLSAALDDGFDHIWIGGGDGSIHLAVNETYKRNPIYGIVPMGTVNALARALHIPMEPEETVRYLLAASPVSINTGKVDDRLFLAYATVGFHAAVFHNVSKALKKRWGILAFWISAMYTVWHMSKLPRFQMRFQYADLPPVGYEKHAARAGQKGTDAGYSFLLSNLRNFAGFGIITDEGPDTNGYLELHHFRHNKLLSLFKWFALLKFFHVKRSDTSSGRMHRWIKWCEISTNSRPINVQVDGEPLDLKNPYEARFEIETNSVRILLQEPEARALGGSRALRTSNVLDNKEVDNESAQ